MNIKEAKRQIENAMRSYLTKDAFGKYIIPIERQRPIFLMGPPGIGKTAIMEQVASELGVGLVSYSMTHHTRQSALGLPYIEKKNYGGKEYSVSEYTMSEIIASVYEMMEQTGVNEGILFLDEINCVSETLAPAMLQFLQYKIFGQHRVPEGWIVVTAGNPPEYNDSVREFDIATWDRLKRIDIEPDYTVWKEYAYRKNTHPAIISYLDIKKSDFYKVESTVDGKNFVTARGWSDLNDMIRLYEQNDIQIDKLLIAQYLQDKKVAEEFAVYYDLFNKYKSDYQVGTILSGSSNEIIKERARKAPFDERLALLGLIINAITEEIRSVCLTESYIKELLSCLQMVKLDLRSSSFDAVSSIERQMDIVHKRIEKGKLSSMLSADLEFALNSTIVKLQEIRNEIMKKDCLDSKKVFNNLKISFDRCVKTLKETVEKASQELSNIFLFCEEIYGDGQEMLILVTELTVNYYCAHFISQYGCKEYFHHNKELFFYERQKEIIKQLQILEL